MPKIISIEGNIGSGKTTIITNLEKFFENDKSLVFMREPVDIWESIRDENDGENILEKFYAYPEKFAFSFQIMAFTSRLSMIKKLLKENPDCRAIICERSLEADRNIFAKMLYIEKMISNIDYQVYMRMYDEFNSDYNVNGFVYIDTDSDVCHKRVMKRGRRGEEGLSLEYLTDCEKYHKEWLLPFVLNAKNVLRIEANADVLYENNDIGVKWLNDIREFIDEMTLN